MSRKPRKDEDDDPPDDDQSEENDDDDESPRASSAYSRSTPKSKRKPLASRWAGYESAARRPSVTGSESGEDSSRRGSRRSSVASSRSDEESKKDSEEGSEAEEEEEEEEEQEEEEEEGNESRGDRSSAGSGSAAQEKQSPKGRRRETAADRAKADEEMRMQDLLEEFCDDSFQAEAFAKARFESMTEETVRKYTSELLRLKDFSALKLKSSVYGNYEQFIRVSKDISCMEGDMIHLRNMLGETTQLLKALQQISLAPDPSLLDAEGMQLASMTRTVVERRDDLLDLSDELDVLIAERRFDEALAMIDKAEPKLDALDDAIVGRKIRREIDDRSARISSLLCEDLLSATISKAQAARIVNNLIKLGQADRARSMFLRSRSNFVSMEIRKLKLQGDVSVYAGELSAVLFTAIKNTLVEYRTLFGGGPLMSTFVVWVIGELTRFAAVLKRHVFPSGNLVVMGECVQTAVAHCKRLEPRGLSLSFYVVKSLEEGLAEAVRQYAQRVQTALTTAMQTDAWSAKEVPAVSLADDPSEGSGLGRSHKVALTESGRQCYGAVHRYIQHVAPLLSLKSVYHDIENGLAVLFTRYVDQLKQHMLSSDLSDNQSFGIMADAYYCAEDLLPRARTHLQNKGCGSTDALDAAYESLKPVHHVLRAKYCTRRSRTLSQMLQWTPADICRDSVDEERASPGRDVKQLFSSLSQIAVTISSLLSPDALRPILTALFDNIAAAIAKDLRGRFVSSKVTTSKSERIIKYGGLQYLALDLRFFTTAAGRYASESVRNDLSEAIQAAVAVFCNSTGRSADTALKSDEWFATTVMRAIASMRSELVVFGVSTYDADTVPASPSSVPSRKHRASISSDLLPFNGSKQNTH
mmetsp:Transcript_30257/g.48891  ORF Transcript_30257/g.48891 Transcript_30257/m.48891 type:complete len:869 (-) Transcript_30257:584-3190(-)|eukprot:CAMPEP_0184654304 /NCGR_PEP_ID=MMETSP0308-20130426/11998_1 /TAXON_ID=38269 /ORGANISM="Gloeochaete witrockiana, Strain SAG 46.84" /LENGTH=868 /DNA_ID=CAMNT_0027090241 /DNA_START=149 /DNA_END=2755 /DNA_ORIENTATION=-